ncbi:hypothetical protein BC834DRAFT_601001 [Gloeopeniophorella convolvens]|nr:hypothetical protein BC834DRAFT_601001 [Gloeopeniophorella convolvens]
MKPGSRYITLVSLCLLIKLGCIALLRTKLHVTPPDTHTYIGSDYPRTWDVGDLPPIRMAIEPTTHFQISGRDADAEWAALAPNDGILHLGPDRQPFSISLFHQLRCLDVIRRDIAGELPPEDLRLSRHCLNYMRQMVLCRADLSLDTVLGREGEAEVRADTHQCVDWRRVYQEFEKNQQEYAQWVSEQQVHL